MIRPATPADAPQVAPLILLAMGRLAAKFANSHDVNAQLNLFVRFIQQTDNQYSYNNILVDEDEDCITGMIMAYDGAELHRLRQPFLDYTTQHLGFKGTPEDETQAGEYYIDCLAVRPDKQGRGIAKQLINAMCRHAAQLGHQTVGLLVSNPNARRLYQSLGFEVQNTTTLLGGAHEHMQLKLPRG